MTGENTENTGNTENTENTGREEQMQPEKTLWSALSAIVPSHLVERRAGPGGRQLDYLNVWMGQVLLDMRCRSMGATWEWSCTHHEHGDYLTCRGRLAVHFDGDSTCRESVGSARLTADWQEPNGPAVEAEAQAWRRCLARFGIGLDLYLEPNQKRMLEQYRRMCEEKGW